MNLTSTRAMAGIFLALWWCSPLFAAAAMDTVRVDLNPLIDAAARSPEQFAVNIPHTFSSSLHGTWSQHGSTSTWVYNARIPTAISMSFHASGVILPPSAVLTVSGERTAFKYVARDVSRSGLWGRPLPGDTVKFSLSVSTSEANQVRLQIDSLQAGYRSLGGGVPDHPHYQEIKIAAAASTGCTENYSCHVSAANQGPAHATVALIIGNLYQCSGTLLNDTRGDGVPYVLTARHCQSGQLGGGNPDAATTVTVYWDAITPCSTQLASIYGNATPTQTGATTVLEQQDLWLIQLDTAPAASDAFYAGWDATGSAFTGGYTIHHALGLDQQYVEWNGTDLLEQIPGATLSIAYDSTFWGVVNGLGNVGPGASGSALFSPNNQVVGSASLATLTGNANSPGICPATPPVTPSPNSVTTLFTALSGAWTSSADRTSSTAGKTLKSLLDPGATGRMTATGLATQPITLSASNTFANTGDLITLSWNIAGAQSCTAWGGTPGDGWSGARAASGTLQVTNLAGGTVNYSLNCLMGNQIGAGSVTTTWNYVEPQTDLTGGSQAPVVLGTATEISWLANVGPCVGSGGKTGDGWTGPQPISGSFAITVTQTGITTYTLTCGTGGRTATNSVYIDGIAPKVTLGSSMTTISAGANFWLWWSGYGTDGTCAASGGSNSDGWAPNNAHAGSNGSTLITETAAGTYTYTMTCTGGGQSTSASQTVVVTSDPPTISLAAVAPQQQVYQLGAATLNVSLDLYWTANVGNCFLSYTSNSGTNTSDSVAGSSGALWDVEFSTGPITYTLQCGSLTATTTINWISAAVPNALSVTDTKWAANVPYPISWNSSVGPCVGSGGVAGDGWAGPKSQAGTQSVTESLPGARLFTLVCGSGAGATTSQALIEVPLPGIQIYSTPVVSPVTLLATTSIVWQSGVGPCTFVDGSTSNTAGVPVAPSGSVTPAPAVAGTYLFSVTCGSGASALYAATLAYVPVNAPTTLTASASSVPVDAPVTLTWSSAGGFCYAGGGDGSAPWIGTLGGSGSGSLIVTSRHVGTFTYDINCNGESAKAVVNYVSVPATSAGAAAPTVTLSASAPTQTADQSISLVWSSKNADSCSASGGEQGDGWTGTLATSGSMSVTETNPGTVIYSITCTGAPPAASASASVIIKSAVAPPTTSSSHGGGGSLDRLLLLILAVLLIVKFRNKTGLEAPMWRQVTTR